MHRAGRERRAGEGRGKSAARIAREGEGEEEKEGPNCRRAAEHYLIP